MRESAWRENSDLSRRHHWFPLEMTSEKRAQKFHTADASPPTSGWCYWLFFNFNQSEAVPTKIWEMTRHQYGISVFNSTQKTVLWPREMITSSCWIKRKCIQINREKKKHDSGFRRQSRAADLKNCVYRDEKFSSPRVFTSWENARSWHRLWLELERYLMVFDTSNLGISWFLKTFLAKCFRSSSSFDNPLKNFTSYNEIRMPRRVPRTSHRFLECLRPPPPPSVSFSKGKTLGTRFLSYAPSYCRLRGRRLLVVVVVVAIFFFKEIEGNTCARASSRFFTSP